MRLFRHAITSTLLGVLGAGALIYVVLATTAETLNFFWNPVGMLIVVGGTLAATLIAFRTQQLPIILRAVGVIFREERPVDKDVQALIRVARAYMQRNLQATEREIKTVESPFLRLGLQLVADNTPVDDILNVLSWRIQKLVEKETGEAKLFRTMATFAPAFGMLGTLVGLVGMLSDLGTGDLAVIGQNMALALITTIYGVVLANLLFRPIAIKLEQRTVQRVARMNLLLEGVLLLRLGRGPSTIEDALMTLGSDRKDEIYD